MKLKTVLLVCSGCFLFSANSHAQLPFYDDFSDGDATDGMPGTWLPSFFEGGTRDASSGDFVVTTTGGARTKVVELTGVRDASFRTQLNFSQVSGPDSDFVFSL